MVEAIRKCYQERIKKELQVFGINGKIEKFVTPKQGTMVDFRKAGSTLPPDEYLID